MPQSRAIATTAVAKMSRNRWSTACPTLSRRAVDLVCMAAPTLDEAAERAQCPRALRGILEPDGVDSERGGGGQVDVEVVDEHGLGARERVPLQQVRVDCRLRLAEADATGDHRPAEHVPKAERALEECGRWWA